MTSVTSVTGATRAWSTEMAGQGRIKRLEHLLARQMRAGKLNPIQGCGGSSGRLTAHKPSSFRDETL